jgi:hypothetical protein
MGYSVAGAGDVNGDGYADGIVGARLYDAGETNEGAAFVFLGSAAGIANGDPATTAATLQSNQFAAQMGISVAGAGDVNGDGHADVFGGASHIGPGRAYVFLGGGGKQGRPSLPRQLRGSGSGTPVASWGGSHASDRFQVRMTAVDPAGRGRVKLEAEYCPPGRPFGSIDCGRVVSPAWADVGAAPGGVPLTRDVLAQTNTLYHWRVRTLRAPFTVTEPGITPPPQPAHGPWRRLSGQAIEADIRTLGGTVAVQPPDVSPWLALAPLATPARGNIALSVTLPGDERAKLELIDVAGRRVRSRELAAGAPGRRTVRLSERGELPSGVYLVRLTQGRSAVVARIVLVN